MRPTIPLYEWRIALDLDQTKYLSDKITFLTDGCTCLFCSNWKMVWRQVLSKKIIDQLKRLQIDPERPSELYQQESKRFRITFNCVGRILSGPGLEVFNEQLHENVRNYVLIEGSKYSTHLSVAYEDKVVHQGIGKIDSIDGKLIQIDFISEVPWILADDPSSVSVPINKNITCNRRLTRG